MSVRYGEQNSLFSCQEHARSLAKVDFEQRHYRHNSLVTRIVSHVGVLENAQVTYSPMTEANRYVVGLEHFVQGHMMHEGPGNSLVMCYLVYDREIELPCLRLSLSTS